MAAFISIFQAAFNLFEVKKTIETKNGTKIITVLSGRSNVFLVSSGDRNILVDAGPESLWKKLRLRLRFEPCKAEIMTGPVYELPAGYPRTSVLHTPV